MLKKITLVSFLFVLGSFQALLGVFPTATELDEADLRRCLAACHSAKTHELKKPEYWKDGNWSTAFRGGKSSTDPRFLALSPRNDTDLPKDYAGPILLAKGNLAIVAFPAIKLWKNPSDWTILQRESESLVPRVGHGDDGRYDRSGLTGLGFKSAFKACRSFSESYLDEIRNYGRDQEISLDKLQVICAGHSFGGMVAQYAAVHLINALYEKSNPGNNVIVVSFGAPRVFDQEAVESWHVKMGGPVNHLRVVLDKDHIYQQYCRKVDDYMDDKTALGKGLRKTGRFLASFFVPVEYSHDTHFTGCAKTFLGDGHSLDDYLEAGKVFGYRFA